MPGPRVPGALVVAPTRGPVLPTSVGSTTFLHSRDHSVSNPRATHPRRHRVGPALTIGAGSMAMLLYYLLLPLYLAEAFVDMLD